MAQRWNNIHEVTLPSGNRPKLRQIDLFSMMSRNKGIPDFLTPIIARQIVGQAIAGEKANIEDMKELAQFLDWLCEKVFVEPRIAEPGEHDFEYVSLENISPLDKMAVMAWEMGGDAGKAAARFPTQPTPNVESTSGS